MRGFAGATVPQFRQFLDVAIASLTETSNHLRDGVDRKALHQRLLYALRGEKDPWAERAKGVDAREFEAVSA